MLVKWGYIEPDTPIFLDVTEIANPRTKKMVIVHVTGILTAAPYQKLHPDKLSQGSEIFFEKFLTMSMCECDNSGGFRLWIK